jgi:hypothetical protein
VWIWIRRCGRGGVRVRVRMPEGARYVRAGACDEEFHQGPHGRETACDDASAAFNGAPDGYVYGVPEEVVCTREAVDVAETQDTAYASQGCETQDQADANFAAAAHVGVPEDEDGEREEDEVGEGGEGGLLVGHEAVEVAGCAVVHDLVGDVRVQVGAAAEEGVEEGGGRGEDVDSDCGIDDDQLPASDDDAGEEDAEGDFQCHHGE